MSRIVDLNDRETLYNAYYGDIAYSIYRQLLKRPDVIIDPVGLWLLCNNLTGGKVLYKGQMQQASCYDFSRFFLIMGHFLDNPILSEHAKWSCDMEIHELYNGLDRFPDDSPYQRQIDIFFKIPPSESVKKDESDEIN